MVVQDVHDFVLKVGGQAGAHFEPETLRIRIGEYPLKCELLKFEFKGYRLDVPVMLTTKEGNERPAAAGYTLILKSDSVTKINSGVTSEHGKVIFDNL